MPRLIVLFHPDFIPTDEFKAFLLSIGYTAADLVFYDPTTGHPTALAYDPRVLNYILAHLKHIYGWWGKMVFVGASAGIGFKPTYAAVGTIQDHVPWRVAADKRGVPFVEYDHL